MGSITAKIVPMCIKAAKKVLAGPLNADSVGLHNNEIVLDITKNNDEKINSLLLSSRFSNTDFVFIY